MERPQGTQREAVAAVVDELVRLHEKDSAKFKPAVTKASLEKKASFNKVSYARTRTTHTNHQRRGDHTPHSSLSPTLTPSLQDGTLKHWDLQAQGLRLLPESFGGLVLSGYLLLNHTQRDEAARAFARESELSPLDPVPHYHRGRALRRAHRFRRAIEAFAEALALDPRYPKPYRNRAIARSRLGEFDLALADADRAVELSPRDAYPLVVRARIRRHRKEPVLPDLEAALALDPTHADAWGLLAEVYLQAGEHERGLAACRRALATYPQHPNGWAILGEFERLAGRRAEALAAFDRSLGFDHKNVAALHGRAQLYLDEQDYERALADLEQAFRVSRGEPKAAISLASGRRLAGDLQGALELCNDVLEAAPHYDALLERAAAQAALGHEDLALRDLERASEVAPQATRPYVQRAAIHLRAKRYPEVLHAVEAALRRNPDDARALALRGLARLELGTPGARQDLERYLKLDPRGTWRDSVERALQRAE